MLRIENQNLTCEIIEHQVRVYDVRVQNRPVAALEDVGVDYVGLTTLCALRPGKGSGSASASGAEPNEVVVGDKAGQVRGCHSDSG